MAQAKTRLTKILTQAVGLVDHPANLRPFLTLKADTSMADENTTTDAAAPDNGSPPDAGPKPLSMPAAVKQGLSADLAAILGKVTAVAEMISGATVDETAEIPTEPLFALDAAAADLDALADKYIMEEETGESMGEAQMAADAPAAKGLTPATKAKVKADEMPRRQARLIAKKRATALKAIHGDMGAAHKALGDCHKAFDGVLKELSGEMAPAAKPDAPKTKSVTEEVADAVAPLIAKLDGLLAANKAAPPAPAPAPHGNAAVVEGATAPVTGERPKSYRQLLADAKKNKG